MQEFIFEESEGTYVLKIQTSMLTGLHNSNILKLHESHIEEGLPNIIVDLSGVKYMNSTGLSLLISLHTKSTKTGGKLMLISVPQVVTTLLSVTKLDQIIPIADSLDAATQQIS